MTETPQKIYLLKQWDRYDDHSFVVQAFRERMDVEKFIEHYIDCLCELSKISPEMFESETGYDVDFFKDDDEESMFNFLRNLFHIEKVDLY